jgi:pyruvate formate lyase activating enzyme
MINASDSAVGTVFDIRHFTMGDGPGVRTTVFLKGCSLRCSWCHNPEGRSPSPEVVRLRLPGRDGSEEVTEQVVGKEFSVDALMKEILQERSVMQASGGGVTFSGGEPLMQGDFLLSLLRRCREAGLHTAVDTNGYGDQEVVAQILPYTDLFLWDIKHVNGEKHLWGTSVSTVRILDNLRFILEGGARVWIRIPIVPGFNFSRGDVSEMITVLKGMPGGIEKVQLIPYRSSGLAKYRQFDIPASPEERKPLRASQLQPFRRMFRRAGFTAEVSG